jgi:adenine-specific DNA-methyltransferase
VWETLVLYDYPEVTGKGRYRPGRFTTDFSLSAKVEDAFRQLVQSVSAIGADLVLSYPSNGLLHQIGRSPLDIVRESYPGATIAAEIAYSHSTMGASKGLAKADVVELVYTGRAQAA